MGWHPHHSVLLPFQAGCQRGPSSRQQSSRRLRPSNSTLRPHLDQPAIHNELGERIGGLQSFKQPPELCRMDASGPFRWQTICSGGLVAVGVKGAKCSGIAAAKAIEMPLVVQQRAVDVKPTRRHSCGWALYPLKAFLGRRWVHLRSKAGHQATSVKGKVGRFHGGIGPDLA